MDVPDVYLSQRGIAGAAVIMSIHRPIGLGADGDRGQNEDIHGCSNRTKPQAAAPREEPKDFRAYYITIVPNE